MIIDTEGIVLRQTKTVGGRRMLLIFSRKYGKISVGTSLSESGKNKSALAARPFTYGRYEIFKGRDSYNLNNAQVIRSYYGFGEDLDKYMAASYVLELTEKLLTEELPQPSVFRLLLDFMEALENRTKKHDTLVLAYMVKLLNALGTMPILDECACCGETLVASQAEAAERPAKLYFGIAEGGMICGRCAEEMRKQATSEGLRTERHTDLRENTQKNIALQAVAAKEALIYSVNFGIVDILKYFRKEPFAAFEKIALDDVIANRLRQILKSYISYHFDIGTLKSEAFLQTGMAETYR